MALGSNGKRGTRHTVPVVDQVEERLSTEVANNAENLALAERIKRDRANVRPYVRTSTQKLKWTHELHQCFLRAVESLGGQDNATPKKIQQRMNKDGITIAHIKSHLQMFRSGKFNEQGLPKSEYTTCQGGQLQSINAGQQGRGPAGSSEPAKSKHEELSGNMDLEPAMALIQLREDSGRSSDSGAAALDWRRRSPDDQEYYSSYVHKKFGFPRVQFQEDGATGNCGFAVELNDKCVQNSPDREPELHQQDQGQSSRPDPWPSPSCDSFDCKASTSHPVNVTDSLGGSKRKAEEVIELNLTMAPRSLRPGFRFASPSTPEEANLNLALS